MNSTKSCRRTSEVEAIFKQVTPYIPALGILSGVITTSKYVYIHISKTVNDAGAEGPFKPEDVGAHTSSNEQEARVAVRKHQQQMALLYSMPNVH